MNPFLTYITRLVLTGTHHVAEWDDGKARPVDLAVWDAPVGELSAGRPLLAEYFRNTERPARDLYTILEVAMIMDTEKFYAENVEPNIAGAVTVGPATMTVLMAIMDAFARPSQEAGQQSFDFDGTPIDISSVMDSPVYFHEPDVL